MQNKFLHLLLFIIISSLFAVQASAQTVDWARIYGNSAEDRALSVARDNDGNLYMTGFFNNSITFGSFTLSGAAKRTFICKLNSAGTVVWAYALVSPTSNSNEAKAIAVQGGSVYVTGSFGGTIDLDPGSGVSSFTSVGSSDIYVVKLNTDGAYQWGKTFGSTRSEEGAAIAVDGLGNAYVSGNFLGATTTPGSNTISFAPGITTQSNDQPSNDLFAVKLSGTNGTPQWAFSIGKSVFGQGEALGGIALSPDGSALYITGLFQGALDFDPSPTGVANLTATSQQDSFVLKVSSSTGGYIWAVCTNGLPGAAVQVAGTGLAPNGIKVGASGNVYATGMFYGTMDFDPGPSSTTLSVSGTLFSAYVWKLSSSGELIWVRNTLRSTGDGIDLDSDENVCLTGSFYNGATVDLDPDPVASTTFTSSGNNDGYASKLTSDGKFIGAFKFGGAVYDGGFDIVPLNNIKIAIVGSVRRNTTSPNTVTFGSITLTPPGDHDAFASSWTFPSSCSPPAITQQPVSTSTVCAGSPVSIPVSFTGTISNYQWYKDGVLVPNQTTATLNLPNPILADAGTYSLVATSSCGSLTTTGFLLTINELVGITAQPAASSTACVSAAVNLTIGISGTVSGYQWYKNGVSLGAAQQGQSLVFANAQSSDAGTYSVVVTGQCNSATSTAFNLSITPTPSLTITAIPGLILIGGNSATLTASGASSYSWSSGENSAAISVSAAGTYSVTGVSTGGCVSTTSVTVTALSGSLTVLASTTAICLGTPVSLTVLGCDAPFTAVWSTGQTGTNITTTPTTTTALSVSCIANIAPDSSPGMLRQSMRTSPSAPAQPAERRAVSVLSEPNRQTRMNP